MLDFFLTSPLIPLLHTLPLRGGSVGAQNITTTAHFVGLGRVQAVSPCGGHALHARDVRSDIRSPPVAMVFTPVFTPRDPTRVGVA